MALMPLSLLAQSGDVPEASEEDKGMLANFIEDSLSAHPPATIDLGDPQRHVSSPMADVMIFVILSGLLAFIFRLRYLSRHPIKEADELEAMVKSVESDETPPKSW